jgi:hypothetical protein
VVIFEVLSGDRSCDEECRSIEQQHRCGATSCSSRTAKPRGVRAQDDRWVGSLFTGDAVLAMPEIGIEMPLAELYEGLDLSQPPNEAESA